MIPLPEDISHADMRQWLHGGTFFWKNSDGTVELSVLRPGEETNQVLTLAGKVHRAVPERMFAHWPECGYVNHKGVAFHIERRQRRQYRRTFNADCVSVRIEGRWDMLAVVPHEQLPAPMLSNDLTHSIFFPEYPDTLAEAFYLARTRCSVAINRHAALVTSGKDTYNLYVRGDLVAVGIRSPGEMTFIVPEKEERRIRKLIEMGG